MGMKWYDWTAYLLVAVGGLNWGLVGLPRLFGRQGFNLVEFLLGTGALSNIVYTVVGIAGVYALYMAVKLNK